MIEIMEDKKCRLNERSKTPEDDVEGGDKLVPDDDGAANNLSDAYDNTTSCAAEFTSGTAAVMLFTSCTAAVVMFTRCTAAVMR